MKSIFSTLFVLANLVSNSAYAFCFSTDPVKLAGYETKAEMAGFFKNGFKNNSDILVDEKCVRKLLTSTEVLARQALGQLALSASVHRSICSGPIFISLHYSPTAGEFGYSREMASVTCDTK